MIIPTTYRTIVGVFCTVAALTGCATTGASSSGESRRQDRNLITSADLEGMEDLSVHEAVRRLRPTWLRYRGQGTFTATGRESLRVYYNRTLFGEADSLSNLMVRDVSEIRFLDSRLATLRFGTDHTVGAIIVTGRGG